MGEIVVFPLIAAPLAARAGFVHAFVSVARVGALGIFIGAGSRRDALPVLVAMSGTLVVLCALGAGWLAGTRAVRRKSPRGPEVPAAPPSSPGTGRVTR